MYVGGGGGSVGTLRITWEPLPPEDHNGWGIGYTVEWKLRPVPGEQTSNRGWTKVNMALTLLSKTQTLFEPAHKIMVLNA